MNYISSTYLIKILAEHLFYQIWNPVEIPQYNKQQPMKTVKLRDVMAEKKFVRYFNGRYFETFTKEQGSLFKRGYMINDNENEAENEK